MAKKAARRSKKAAGARKKGAARRAKTTAAETSRPIWTHSRFALWSRRWDDPNDANPTAILLHHPTAPFPDDPLIVDQIDDTNIKIQKLAFDYLEEVNQLTDIDYPLGLPEEWLKQLNLSERRENPTFDWLPIGWPSDDPEFGDPLVSFRVVRETRGERADEALILLASERREPKEKGQTGFLGSEFGIRVVVSLRRRSDNKLEVRITGMSASLPFGRYLTDGVSTKSWSSQAAFNLVLEGKAAVRAEIADLLRLENESVHIRGIRIAEIPPDPSAGTSGGVQVEWRGTGQAKTTDGAANATPHSFVFGRTFTRDQDGALTPSPLALQSKAELVADATPGFARVFPLDPESKLGPSRKRHPTGSEYELDKAREREEVINTGYSQLIYPYPHPHPPPPHLEQMRVELCRGFVVDDRTITTAGLAKAVSLSDTGPDAPYIRSNDFAAISAYQNVKRFLQRLEAYGLGVHRYFQIAKLPLKLFYRSGIRPGPGKDGQAVNARVLVEGWKVDFEGPTKPGDHPKLQIHFALANLSTRARKPWYGNGRSQAEPLGIAADPRWVWHEIGHVLLMACVGEPQFRFCHSPGDALAAIVNDPRSELAKIPNWRGATFPWVFIPRRHDRCVSHGWSWGGSLHYALSQVPESQAPRRKGYWTEQILSSSLFRLYRCIGGDTTEVGSPDKPDIGARESASHYSVFLIMKGIQVLGPSTVVPAIKPEQFVAALEHADTGTPVWDVTLPSDWNPPLHFRRIGGCVHKVIHWAFEVQGMNTPPGNIINAPGSPPPVDIYIESLRPTADPASGTLDYGKGSYVPVSLDWNVNQNGLLSNAPAWQASQSAITVVGNKITVSVGNRGTAPATNVEVKVWCRAWTAGTAPPSWNDPLAVWQPCPLAAGQPQFQTVAAGSSVPFGFSHTPPANRYLILAQATCADDPANSDPAAGLPCSSYPVRLIDLVPNDNNLGLRVVAP
jgi:hypothetical protein